MKWPTVSLGKIISLEYGTSLPERARDSKGPFVVLGSNGIIGQHTTALVDGPGVVVGRKGSAGKITWIETDFWPIDTTFYVICKIELELRWVFYLLQFLDLERLSIITGVPGLNRNDAYQLKVPLPPRSEQQRIVEILDQADALRRKRVEADARMERILPALFIKMFGDPATNPREWKLTTLAEAGAEIRYGLGQPPKLSQDGLPLIRATNIDYGAITEKDLIFVAEENVPKSRNAFLSADEVIVVRSGAYTGDVAQVTDKWVGSVIGYDLVITPGSAFCGEFIEAYLLTPHIQDNYFGNIKARAGQPHLNASQLSATPILIPPKELQLCFAESVKSIRKMRSHALKAKETIESLFNLLLQRAFSGDLTAKWREAHLQELLAEMEAQAHLLNEEPVQLTFAEALAPC